MIQMMGEIRVGSVESGNCSGRGHSEGLIGLAKTQAPEGALTFNNESRWCCGRARQGAGRR
jgi:hypothetical protein